MARKRPEDLRSSSLVRGERPALFRPSLAHGADGLRTRRLRGQAGDRDHQHLERHQRLPHAFQAAGRGGEARRVGGGRLSGRIAGDDAVRAVPEADDDDVSQLSGDGGGGGFALLSCRRRGADGRLRQDHARAAHGRDLDESPGDLHAGGPDAARQLARAMRWARAATSGNTGRNCAPARSRRRTGRRSNTASRARPVIA